MKIDLVYLWVNGNDEKWLAKKNATLVKSGMSPVKSSVGNNRWRDNNELKYSLRSAQKFAPWINRIFIVTDEQTPAWLNINNPKVTIIDHKQIIPNDKLPLFNSTAIELFLWNIPKLSEHFLYANDDMFFGKPVDSDFFFDGNGNPIVIMKERKRNFEKPDDSSPVTSREFMVKSERTIKFAYKKLGQKYHLAFKHAIWPIRKSYMKENFLEIEENIMQTTCTPFRDVNNIHRIFMPLFDNAKGRNTIVLNWRIDNERIVYENAQDTWQRRTQHMLSWFFATVTETIRYDCYDRQWKISKYIEKYKPTMFAINDTSQNKSAFEKTFALIKKMFPDKSEFER